MKPAFLVMDKPVGITSHDVVAVLRAVLGIKKVGHTGTLDPFATGVLPLALGPATRLIQYLDEGVKIYDATIQLGAETDTGDPTGEIGRTAPIPDLDEARILDVLAGFAGIRQQVPPRHSAVKVNGRPLYAYARAGEEVEAAARPIRIDRIDLVDRGPDWLRVEIHCGRGTYARVLAVEIAEALGSAGHLSALRRLRSGPFLESAALDFPRLSEIVSGDPDWRKVLRPARGAERMPWRPRDLVRRELMPWLLSPAQALDHLPAVDVPEALRARVRSGGGVPGPPAGVELGGRYRVMGGEELLALAVLEDQGARALRVVDAA